MKATKAYRESGDSVGGIGTSGTSASVTLGDVTAALPYVSFAYDGQGRKGGEKGRKGVGNL